MPQRPQNKGNYILDSLSGSPPKSGGDRPVRKETLLTRGFPSLLLALLLAFALIAVVQAVENGFIFGAEEPTRHRVIASEDTYVPLNIGIIDINNMPHKPKPQIRGDRPHPLRSRNEVVGILLPWFKSHVANIISTKTVWQQSQITTPKQHHIQCTLDNSRTRTSDVSYCVKDNEEFSLCFLSRIGIPQNKFWPVCGDKFPSHLANGLFQFSRLVVENPSVEKKGEELKSSDPSQDLSPSDKTFVTLRLILSFLFAGLSLFLIFIGGLYGNDKGSRLSSYLFFGGLLCAGFTLFLGWSVFL